MAALVAQQAALQRERFGCGGREGARRAARAFHRPAPPPAVPQGPASPALSPAPDARPAPPGPRGGRTRERGWNSSQGAPSRHPSRALASSRSPSAPLPAASQLRAPGAGKKPHAPARNAGPSGRGAGAGQGRARPGRAGSAPPGRLVTGKEPARALPGRPCRPRVRPVRRPCLIAVPHTFPARHADGTTRGLPG